MERISGTITALNSKTWKEHTRTVKPFDVEESMAWIDIVDMAIERTFPEDHFEQHEDAIDSSIPPQEEA